MSQIKLSIIVPTFQSEKTLSSTLRSLPYDNTVEVLLIDGGSTDQTLSILKNFHHPNIRVVSEKDRGIYDAMNKGVEIAAGDFLYFLGSDDQWRVPFDHLSPLLRDPNTVYYGDILKQPSKVQYGGHFSRIRLMIQNIPHQGIFYPKKVFQKYRYNIELKICADHYLNLQCAFDSRFKIKRIPFTIAHFSEAGISSRTPRDHLFEQARLDLIQEKGTVIEKLIFKLWNRLRSPSL